MTKSMTKAQLAAELEKANETISNLVNSVSQEEDIVLNLIEERDELKSQIQNNRRYRKIVQERMKELDMEVELLKSMLYDKVEELGVIKAEEIC
ncbi:hypothetical protein MTBPR1_10072 [Candidatus Terasakiella magnetica]|uniref:Uncharacterized protein n=1 Tax=Candidatus Terasakiella magnetica TaxID=1867952 RepID=A0A1C3RC35_9PROT|nr:hypothetical protein [Candidatus Terasakiella magnetica]SCA54825.1 hypothetical protein MTBPR1_10072 [Candidatus Terasakiella magnetica]